MGAQQCCEGRAPRPMTPASRVMERHNRISVSASQGGDKSELEKQWRKLIKNGLSQEAITDAMFQKLHTLPIGVQEMFHKTNQIEFNFLFDHILKGLFAVSRLEDDNQVIVLHDIGTTHVDIGVNAEAWNTMLKLLLTCLDQVAEASLPSICWDTTEREKWHAWFKQSFSLCKETCTKHVNVLSLRSRREGLIKSQASRQNDHGSSFSTKTSSTCDSSSRGSSIVLSETISHSNRGSSFVSGGSLMFAEMPVVDEADESATDMPNAILSMKLSQPKNVDLPAVGNNDNEVIKLPEIRSNTLKPPVVSYFTFGANHLKN